MNFQALADKIGLEADDYRELVELFVETGQADYDRMKRAFTDGDAQQVARSAHTISGASGNLGLMNVYDIAKRIELAANDGRLDHLTIDVEALQTLFEEIARSVQH